MSKNRREEFLVTITHNGETLNARCETETQARYLASLVHNPNPAGLEEIKIHRVCGMIVGQLLVDIGEGPA